MKLQDTPIDGVFVIEPEPIADFRGYFARAWDQAALPARAEAVNWMQSNIGFSHTAGTLRGVHFQRAPHGESKLVWCPTGRVFDVVVDLRVDSPTALTWFGVELSAENHKSVYLPPGCGHGYQTLVDATHLSYLTSHAYVRESAFGVRWDDPALEIEWPLPVGPISDQDKTWPLISNVMELSA